MYDIDWGHFDLKKNLCFIQNIKIKVRFTVRFDILQWLERVAKLKIKHF